MRIATFALLFAIGVSVAGSVDRVRGAVKDDIVWILAKSNGSVRDHR